MGGTTIEISPDYGWVIVAASVVGLQVLLQGFIYAGGARKVFDAAYYAQPAAKALVEDHKKATGEDKLPRGGYPDMGTGRYAALLPYASWYRFANAQRAHYNYVESVASVLSFSLLGGLHYPRFAAGATAGYVVGREVYAYLYSKKGPGARSAGALILDVALLALFGSAVASGLKIAGASKALGF